MENDNIIKITGEVSSGGGHAIANFDPVKKLIAERMGFASLISGTLNIIVDNHCPLTAVDAIITDKEYKHEKECIKLKRCKINGKKSVMLRPSQHEDPIKKSLYNRIEVMSDIHFKNDLNLKDDDSVEIEIESGFKENNNWWNL